MKQTLMILTGAVLVSNIVLTQFLGICSFLGVSKKTENAFSMSISVLIVMTFSTIATWPVYTYVLVPYELEYLKTIVFIVIIAAFVQLLEITLKKFMNPVYKTLGVYLALITTNCAVLGVTMINIDKSYSFLNSIVNAVGTGLGYLVAMMIFSGVRGLIEGSDIPKMFRGIPITLIAASLLAMTFMGFSGVIEGIFK